MGYCSLSDVTERLGAATAQQASGLAPNATRDSLITDLIVALSRRFDDETEADNPGAYLPTYDVRLYSGRGAQLMTLDDYLTISKVEQNTTQGSNAGTWQDLTADFTVQKMAMLPLRFYPKNRLFRSQTFLVDAYKIGNVRLTGVWGNCYPDMTLSPPTAPWAWAPALNQAALNALSPDGLGNGWWKTPEQVRKAIAEWTVYTFQAGRAQYSDIAGGGGTTSIYRKGIPPEVQMVIDHYRGGDLKLAMITLDGVDTSEAAAYPDQSGDQNSQSRWAGWISR